jgi:hypothetical protein
MRLAIVYAVVIVVVALIVPAASAASHPAKARHVAGGLPFKPATANGGLPFTGIGLGGTALLGVLMVSGGLLVRRAAAADS